MSLLGPDPRGPVIASSNRYNDIVPYSCKLFAADPKLWGTVFPWEFPQNASREVEQTFLKGFFSEQDIYLQSGEAFGGFRFLKQVWYNVAMFNWEQRVPRVVQWWFDQESNRTLIKDPNMTKWLLKEQVVPKTFFQAPELEMYGEQFLKIVVSYIQLRLHFELQTHVPANTSPALASVVEVETAKMNPDLNVAGPSIEPTIVPAQHQASNPVANKYPKDRKLEAVPSGYSISPPDPVQGVSQELFQLVGRAEYQPRRGETSPRGGRNFHGRKNNQCYNKNSVSHSKNNNARPPIYTQQQTMTSEQFSAYLRPYGTPQQVFQPIAGPGFHGERVPSDHPMRSSPMISPCVPSQHFVPQRLQSENMLYDQSGNYHLHTYAQQNPAWNYVESNDARNMQIEGRVFSNEYHPPADLHVNKRSPRRYSHGSRGGRGRGFPGSGTTGKGGRDNFNNRGAGTQVWHHTPMEHNHPEFGHAATAKNFQIQQSKRGMPNGNWRIPADDNSSMHTNASVSPSMTMASGPHLVINPPLAPVPYVPTSSVGKGPKGVSFFQVGAGGFTAKNFVPNDNLYAKKLFAFDIPLHINAHQVAMLFQHRFGTVTEVQDIFNNFSNFRSYYVTFENDFSAIKAVESAVDGFIKGWDDCKIRIDVPAEHRNPHSSRHLSFTEPPHHDNVSRGRFPSPTTVPATRTASLKEVNCQSIQGSPKHDETAVQFTDSRDSTPNLSCGNTPKKSKKPKNSKGKNKVAKETAKNNAASSFKPSSDQGERTIRQVNLPNEKIKAVQTPLVVITEPRSQKEEPQAVPYAGKTIEESDEYLTSASATNSGVLTPEQAVADENDKSVKLFRDQAKENAKEATTTQIVTAESPEDPLPVSKVTESDSKPCQDDSAVEVSSLTSESNKLERSTIDTSSASKQRITTPSSTTSRNGSLKAPVPLYSPTPQSKRVRRSDALAVSALASQEAKPKDRVASDTSSTTTPAFHTAPSTPAFPMAPSSSSTSSTEIFPLKEEADTPPTPSLQLDPVSTSQVPTKIEKGKGPAQTVSFSMFSKKEKQGSRKIEKKSKKGNTLQGKPVDSLKISSNADDGRGEGGTTKTDTRTGKKKKKISGCKPIHFADIFPPVSELDESHESNSGTSREIIPSTSVLTEASEITQKEKETIDTNPKGPRSPDITRTSLSEPEGRHRGQSSEGNSRIQESAQRRVDEGQAQKRKLTPSATGDTPLEDDGGSNQDNASDITGSGRAKSWPRAPSGEFTFSFDNGTSTSSAENEKEFEEEIRKNVADRNKPMPVIVAKPPRSRAIKKRRSTGKLLQKQDRRTTLIVLREIAPSTGTPDERATLELLSNDSHEFDAPEASDTSDKIDEEDSLAEEDEEYDPTFG